MKTISPAFAIFVLSITAAYSQVTKDGKILEYSRISGSVAVINRTDSSLDLSVSISNQGQEPVYIATDPVLWNGERGYYIEIKKPDELIIESKVFGVSDRWIIEDDKTSVNLKLLQPTQEITFEITIASPATVTLPYGNAYPSESMDITRIKTVHIRFGVFPFESGIQRMLRMSIPRDRVSGKVSPYTGPYRDKSLYEIQRLETVSISL